MLANEVDRYRGRWVAVDLMTDEVRADATSFPDLQEIIATRHIERIVVHRVPAADDPLFLGLA
ncbi:MAG TPA: hypothetical protein VGM93_12910 [Acidimicrobiales bacterium]